MILSYLRTYANHIHSFIHSRERKSELMWKTRKRIDSAINVTKATLHQWLFTILIFLNFKTQSKHWTIELTDLHKLNVMSSRFYCLNMSKMVIFSLANRINAHHRKGNIIQKYAVTCIYPFIYSSFESDFVHANCIQIIMCAQFRNGIPKNSTKRANNMALNQYRCLHTQTHFEICLHLFWCVYAFCSIYTKS